MLRRLLQAKKPRSLRKATSAFTVNMFREKLKKARSGKIFDIFDIFNKCNEKKLIFKSVHFIEEIKRLKRIYRLDYISRAQHF